MKALETIYSSKKNGNFISTEESLSMLDITSGNEFNENVATDYPNGLAIVFTQEINSDNEASKFRRA